MRVVFISNYFNHHQKPFCDSLFERYRKGFVFIATSRIPEWRQSLGYSEMNSEYVKHIDSIDKQLIDDSEVVIKGDAPYSLIENRIKDGKLTYLYSERIYKSSIPWLKIPIHALRNYIKYGRYKNVYMLCAGAYTAYDYYLTRCFVNKCYKWGYFPEVIHYKSIEDLLSRKNPGDTSIVSILWVGRTIHWKHPEAMIYLASALRSNGYRFHVEMIGTGEMDEMINKSIETEGLKDCFSFLGPLSPMIVRTHMETADIFVFTSDRNEGWGAVLNEAMNSACAVVAANRIGSVPFLINDGQNGLVFNDCNWADLYEKVRFLIENPSVRMKVSMSAYNTVINVWNANVAVKNLQVLTDSLNKGVIANISEGPCSVAPLLKG